MTISHTNPAALHPSGPDHGRPAVGPPPPDRREEAIARLLACGSTPDHDHARRFLDFARTHAVNLDHLWCSIAGDDRFEAVALAVPNPGRTAMFFASQPHSAEELQRTCEVIDALCLRLAQDGLHLAQTLLDVHDHDSETVFAGARFRRLATLSYLERPLRSRLVPAPPQWADGARLVTYQPSLRHEFAEVLDASYEQTLDCPGLRGCRTTVDILEGHRAAGAFDANLWTMLLLDDRPAGALLLNPASDGSGIELVYLGLAMWARGRGLGTQLLRHALHQVASRPERVMTLAVDEANTPALALYKREHFKPVLRRAAMIRPLR
jgi:ribosomal protein S18 acetylase RimI-like enzyme